MPVNSMTYKALFERFEKSRKIGHETQGKMVDFPAERFEMIRFRAGPGKTGVTGPVESSILGQLFCFQRSRAQTRAGPAPDSP